MTDFSVVIPLYNKASHISRAIQSILDQSYQPNEIIIVDDGSTDNSAEIVTSKKYNKIILIHQENAGAAAARNRGVKVAQSNLVAFLDADDEWKPDHLSRIQELIHLFPFCGMYATSSLMIQKDKSERIPKLPGIPPVPWKGVINNFFDLLQVDWAFNSSSICIPKKIYEKVGGCPVGVTISEDVYLWIKIYIHYSIAFDPFPSAIYHLDSENKVTDLFTPLKEMPYIQLIHEAVNRQILPNNQKESSLDFVAQQQIKIAKNNIKVGNNKYARLLLTSINDNKKYSKEWRYWYYYTYCPLWLIRVCKKFRNGMVITAKLVKKILSI